MNNIPKLFLHCSYYFHQVLVSLLFNNECIEREFAYVLQNPISNECGLVLISQ